MAIVNEARAVLTAEDRASAVLAMVARNFDRLDRAASRLDANGAVSRRNQVVQQQASRTAVLTDRMGAAALRATGPLVGLFGVYGAASMLNGANKAFATNERAMTRIAVTADASAEAQQASWTQLQQLARETALPIDKVRAGLDALVASGRSLPEAMGFLPAVAQTAQASGAEVADIAKTADSVGESFKIAGKDMQTAFDIMAAGGKAGKFELKDMARYLPSLGPAASAIGFEGKKGLADLVAMLQVMRKGAGTSEEAVASMNNVLAKMESDKTTKAFKNLGVDSEAAFKKARAEGRNLVEVFENLVDTALKGDRSRLGEIIDDMEFKRGVQALMMYRGEWQKLSQTMQSSSAGTVAQDLARVTANSQSTFDRFKNAADRLADSLGRRLSPAFKAVAENATAAMDAVNSALQPSETDEQRLARIGNRPLTRAEQSIENARRAQERQRMLDDPSSDIYGMRDGGFAGAGRRRQPTHLDQLDGATTARKRMQADQAAAERRERDSARVRFLMDERKSAQEERLNPRGNDAFRDVEALSRARTRVSTDLTQGSADNMVSSSGEASREVMAAVMNLAQLVRAEKLTATGESNVFALGGAGARDGAMNVIATAMREIAERRAQAEGRPVDEGRLQEAIASLKMLAERIGETVPATGPKARVDGIYPSAEEILNGKLTAEVKPDQITASVSVDAKSDVTVKVEPSPNFISSILSQATRITTRDSRGISLPGKETSRGGGGGGGGGAM
ncbi:phage tail tape measure protein [Bosea sp. (in: a-proteobacteria)]|uniref:phage tail tape measure protein n=1 Tax=Bosea sp. (in: a-proteobacteria) TaxID=1871050 RepID=UPI002736F2CC|nr:phage tail tape measure protein [Bosea sp. (in: a-proteobacteria)]MDP3407234.1 phage tail tape measure protein [Bosea sp. (in: a-proteobacteria)]